MTNEASKTPRVDSNEVDLKEVLSVETFSNGTQRIVKKYVPSYVARQLETELTNAKNMLHNAWMERDQAIAQRDALLSAIKECRLVLSDLPSVTQDGSRVRAAFLMATANIVLVESTPTEAVKVEAR